MLLQHSTLYGFILFALLVYVWLSFFCKLGVFCSSEADRSEHKVNLRELRALQCPTINNCLKVREVQHHHQTHKNFLKYKIAMSTLCKSMKQPRQRFHLEMRYPDESSQHYKYSLPCSNRRYFTARPHNTDDLLGLYITFDEEKDEEKSVVTSKGKTRYLSILKTTVATIGRNFFGLPTRDTKLYTHTMHTRNNPFPRHTYNIIVDVFTHSAKKLSYDIELFYALRDEEGEIQRSSTPNKTESTRRCIRLKDLIEFFVGNACGCLSMKIPKDWRLIHVIYKGHRSYTVENIPSLLEIVERHDVCIDVHHPMTYMAPAINPLGL